MKLLHILRSEPDATTQIWLDELSNRNESKSVSLSDEAVDYDALVRQIFDADQVISWW